MTQDTSHKVHYSR